MKYITTATDKLEGWWGDRLSEQCYYSSKVMNIPLWLCN